MVTFTDRDDIRQSYTGTNPVDRSSVSGPNRDRIRELRAKGQLNRMPRDNIFKRAADSYGDSNVNKAIHKMNVLPSLAGFAMSATDKILRNKVMHGQNKSYFGGNWLHDKIPGKVRESLMTPSDQEFYDKYMNLASMAQDTTKRDYYLQQANTAKQNAQITGRLNYGLGSLIDTEGEYLNKEGLPSYTEDLFSEGYDRFDEERFKEAMGYEEPIVDEPYIYKGEFTGDAEGNVNPGYYGINTPSSYRDDITDAVVGDGPDITEAYELEKEILSKEEPSKYTLGNLSSIFDGEDYSPDFDKDINKIQDPGSREAAKNAALAFQMYYKESQDKFDPKFEELYQVYVDAIIQGRLVDGGIKEPE